MVHIIGGGLAGSEAAWQAASLGVPVVLYEMRPVRPTAVHKTDRLAELVCSNSFRGDKLDNAVGLLKEEMRRLGSLVMRAAAAARVPAGAALAVDREKFSDEVSQAIASHPLITIRREEIREIPTGRDGPVIIATGPLTSDALSKQIAALVGGDHLYFYDAISPIVLADSIDRTKVFRASRWGRSLNRSDPAQTQLGLSSDAAQTQLRLGSDAAQTQLRLGSNSAQTDVEAGSELSLSGVEAGFEPGLTPVGEGPACGLDDGEGDYLNCPFTRDEYAGFYAALTAAEKAPLHEFDDPKFFEGCLPIEVMAGRGIDTLRFGPMKPVGLPDPRTGREP